MKKQKLSLGRLSLTKAHIASLNAASQDEVFGGNASLAGCPVISLQGTCVTRICATRIQALCPPHTGITVYPGCPPPTTSLNNNCPTLACTL
ncbi:class I lanthipeptide [Taibaiella koreensis]|uniref:class I lanthipeptide n=1 Tax=Taibaiella koreensis TaxID=1268548 RepID=UPI000E599154|nr:class I lanthipeptide [Taibaiella koreensis]